MSDTTTYRYYFEDFKPGDVLSLGEYTLTKAEIIDFARQFDPQPFHIDEEAAGRSMYGGLIASGWHTCSLVMRLMCDSHLNQCASLGSPGLDNIRWLKPVRPGDTLRAERHILETRTSQSKPGVGIIRSRWDVRNQHNEMVMTMEGYGMFGRRAPAGQDA